MNFSNFPSYISIILLVIFIIIISFWLYIRYIRPDPIASPLDLIKHETSGQLSMTKIGQVLGVIISTWVVVKLTLMRALNIDIFLVYLSYIAGADAFSKWLHLRYSNKPNEPKEPKEEEDSK